MTDASLDAAPYPLGRVLSAEEAGLYRDAAGALALAAETVRRRRAEAEREIAAERDRVLAETRARAEADAARLLADTAAAAQRALAALPPELAGAIADGVAKIVGGLDLADAVARAAHRALSDLAERNGVAVRVSPAAAEAVRAKLAAWGDGARVVPDADLPPDGCVLETRAGFVRAGLQEQLDALAAALRDAARGQDGDRDGG